MTPIAAALALAIAASGSPPANAADPTLKRPDVLVVRSDGHDRLTLPVSIGTNGPFEFLIDTAAERTVVSNSLVSRLGLLPQARGTVLGIAGQRQVDTVDVDDIRYGRVSYDGLVVPVLDAGDLGADGIVGLDGLADRRVLFDFGRNRVALIDAHSRESSSSSFDIVVTARRRSNQLIMTNAVVDGIRTDIVIDTGSEISTGNRALERALARRGAGGATTIHSVTGQDIAATYGLIHELAIQTIQIRNPLVTFADAPTFAALQLEKKPALLLGMHDLRLFRRFAIDFASRKIMFDLPS